LNPCASCTNVYDESYTEAPVKTRITRRPAERAVLAGAGIKFFYCGRAWFKMEMHEQAWKFLRSWPQIVEMAEHHRGRVFEIEGANLKVTPVG
jgi:hypothetical protein